ncbi:MAG: HEAT repeat domain-containing protein [Verrucomicrobiota bacterium]|nr:HEAT repeat domain-containing protein [Verrucomicrobiota bacterium]
MVCLALGFGKAFGQNPRVQIPFELHDKSLRLKEWARQPMLLNPVALSFDYEGRLFVVETARRGTVDIDIRAHKEWVIDDLSNENIPQLRRMFRTKMAPELSEQNKSWLVDRNGDGSHDWNDLMSVKERIHLLQDTDNDGRADVAKVFAEGFNEEINGVMAGVLPYRGDVFATIYPDVWKLNDTDGDGYADKREVFFHGFGVHAAFDGHDLHGLTVGPDGKLYFSVGDNGFSVRTREGRLLHHPNTGGVLRCDWDGSDLEVFATGLRNVQELAFDDFGNLFSVDNDGDIREERERFVYITQGSDSGWRLNWQFKKGGWPGRTQTPEYCPWIDEKLWLPHWPGQAAYITPPMSEFSVGPGGFKYNPGTALNDRYKGAFFLCEFPVQKVTAFKTKPQGAYFKMVDEHIFLFGMMASAINFGPDGSLYVANWDGKWQPNELGSIWMVDDPALRKSEQRKQVAELLRGDFADHTNSDLVNLLAHADQRIRLEAQFELAKRDRFDELLGLATNPRGDLLARVHAMWGLSQLAPHEQRDERLVKRLPFVDKDPEIRAQAAKLAGTRALKSAAPRLVDLLHDESVRVQFHAAMALGQAGSNDTTSHLVALLERNNDKDAYIRHAAIMGLAGGARSEQLTGLNTHNSAAVRAAAVATLRRLRHTGAKAFLNDENEWVLREAISAIHDDKSILESLPAVANLLTDSSNEPEAITRRLLSANLRVGRPENAQRLIDYALDTSNPDAMRSEALLCMRDWNRRPFVDRVEGRVRALSKRDDGLARRLVEANLQKLFKASDGEVLAELIRLCERLQIKLGAGQLLVIAQSDSQELAARIQAVRSVTGKENIIRQLIDLAKNEHSQLQVAAVRKLAEVVPGRFAEKLSGVWSKLSEPAQQAFLSRLGKDTSDRGNEILTKAFASLLDGKLPKALELDVVTAAKARQSRHLKQLLRRYEASQPAQDGVAEYRATLAGGDAVKGKHVYDNHVAAQCVRCHDGGGKGNQVGPELAGISKRVDKNYLLRSLVAPNTEIANGFGVTLIELANGDTLIGRVGDRTDQMLTLIPPQGEPEKIAVDAVKKITESNTSVMPPMGAILTKHELRDLIAYLETL